MAAPDLDVIKDIPGYKVILKAVLKSQIQQLVEQLAATTEEESVILTASVADGTLSHLGSQSGKGFLEDHEDIKSQFLGFCLKKHHRDKQEKERLEAEAAINQARLEAARHTSPQGPYMSRSPRFSLPHGQRPVHPVALTRTPRGRGIRSPGNRHEPYPPVRPPRRSSTEPSPAGADSDSGQFIKIEPNLESSDNETSNQESSQAYAPSNSKSESGEHEDDVKSESSNSTIPNESQAEGLGLDSDLSNIISGSSQTQGGDSGETDADVSVKMEAISESELELEITGVEPGRPSLQDNWDPNISMGMNFDPSQGATGNQADITGQGYTSRRRTSQASMRRTSHSSNNFLCSDCGTTYSTRSGLRKHKILKHTESQPYKCCGKSYAERSALEAHQRAQHGRRKLECEKCKKTFTTTSALKRHMSSHGKAEDKEFTCNVCMKNFLRRDHLLDHIKGVHEKSKRFSCQKCFKKFAWRTGLHRHIFKAHQ